MSPSIGTTFSNQFTFHPPVASNGSQIPILPDLSSRPLLIIGFYRHTAWEYYVVVVTVVTPPSFNSLPSLSPFSLPTLDPVLGSNMARYHVLALCRDGPVARKLTVAFAGRLARDEYAW